MGTVYLVAAQTDGTDVQVSRFDGEAWSPVALLEGVEHAGALALVELPLGRLLLSTITDDGATLLYSDDLGETWLPYAADVIASADRPATTTARGAMARHGDGLLWLVTDTGGDVYQYASGDLGATWSRVTTVAALGSDVDCFTLPDGSGLGVTYRATSTTRATYRALVSPWQELGSVSATTIHVDATIGVVGWAEPAGRL